MEKRIKMLEAKLISENKETGIKVYSCESDENNDLLKNQNKYTVTNQTVKIRGKIDVVFCSYPNFTAGRIRVDDGKLLSFSGKIAVNPDDQVILVGKMINDPKYGLQIKVDSVELDLILDRYGLENFLAKNKEIKNIGPAKAKIIVDNFGDNFEFYLKEKPEEIARIAKLDIKDVQNLREVWESDKELNQISIWLASFGLTHHQIKTITHRFGNSAKAILEKNPYLLIGLVDNFGFKKVDIIARQLNVPKEFPPRITAGVKYCVQEELDEGHCWIEYDNLIDKSNKLLILDCAPDEAKQMIVNAIHDLIKRRVLTYQEYNGNYCVGLPGILNTERYIYNSLLAGNISNPHFKNANTNPETYISKDTTLLNEQQFAAVNNFLSHQKSLISGGAGTGKTFTLSTILSLCEERGLDVALAAPTGKAAKRMEQVTGSEASTVHRLLGWQPGGTDSKSKGKTKKENKNVEPSFEFCETNPLPMNVVIIDEFSMMDVFLTRALLSAISSKTSLVLVGDHNQLPPVGAGNVLRDLIVYNVIPTTILTQVVRQSGPLKENSNAILRGIVMPTTSSPAAKNDSILSPWILDKQKEPANVIARIGQLYYTELEQYGFDLLSDVQLLTPRKTGPLGTRALNNALQVLFQQKLYNFQIEKTPDDKPPVFHVGDKVIQTRNDYDINVMNGTIGIIQNFGKEQVLNDDGKPTGRTKDVIVVKFEFEDDLKNVDKSNNDLELAYALTIHKTQGSEFQVAICIIHSSHRIPMHHRHLFYTAVTRARRSCIIIGDPWGMRKCAETIKNDNRRTFLSLFIAKHIQEQQKSQEQKVA